MTNSLEPMTEERKKAFLERVKTWDATPADKKEHPEDLPSWVKTALVFRAVLGETYKEAAERFGKTPATLGRYAKSPAAKLWVGALSEFVSDPLAMARAILQMSAVGITMERMAALEGAKRSGDWALVDKITKDLQEKLGIVAKKETEAPIQIRLNLNQGMLKAVEADSDYETIKDADFEVEE